MLQTGALKDAPRELEMRWMRQVVAFCAASDWKSRQMRRGAVRDLSQRDASQCDAELTLSLALA